MLAAKSLLGLSLLETNLENNKSRVDVLKDVIRKQNKALKEILNERKSENEDKIQVECSLETPKKENKRRKKGLCTDK